MAAATCEICGYDGSLSWLIRCKNSHRCGQGRHLYCLEGFEVPLQAPEDLGALGPLECSLCSTALSSKGRKKTSTAISGSQPKKPITMNDQQSKPSETFGYTGSSAFASLDAQDVIYEVNGDDDDSMSDVNYANDGNISPQPDATEQDRMHIVLSSEYPLQQAALQQKDMLDFSFLEAANNVAADVPKALIAASDGSSEQGIDGRPLKRIRLPAAERQVSTQVQLAGSGQDERNLEPRLAAAHPAIGNVKDCSNSQVIPAASGLAHVGNRAGGLIKHFKGQLKGGGRHAQFLDNAPAPPNKRRPMDKILAGERNAFDDLNADAPGPSVVHSKSAKRIGAAGTGGAPEQHPARASVQTNGSSDLQDRPAGAGTASGDLSGMHDQQPEAEVLPAGATTTGPAPNGKVGTGHCMRPSSSFSGQAQQPGRRSAAASKQGQLPLGSSAASTAAECRPPGFGLAGRGWGHRPAGRGAGRTILGAVPAGRTGQQGVQAASFNIMQAIGKSSGAPQGVSTTSGLGTSGVPLQGQNSGSHPDVSAPLSNMPSVGPSQPSLEPATLAPVKDRRVSLWIGLVPLTFNALPQKPLCLTMTATNPHDSIVRLFQHLPTSDSAQSWKLILDKDVPSNILETRQFYQENMPCETCLVVYPRYSIGAADQDFKQLLSKLREMPGSILAMELRSHTQDKLARDPLLGCLLASPSYGGKPAPYRLFFVPHQVPIDGFHINKGVEDCLLCLTGSRHHIHLTSSWNPIGAIQKGIKGILKHSSKEETKMRCKVQFRHLDQGAYEQVSRAQLQKECKEEREKDVKSRLAKKRNDEEDKEEREAELAADEQNGGIDQLPQLNQSPEIMPPDEIMPPEVTRHSKQPASNVEDCHLPSTTHLEDVATGTAQLCHAAMANCCPEALLSTVTETLAPSTMALPLVWSVDTNWVTTTAAQCTTSSSLAPNLAAPPPHIPGNQEGNGGVITLQSLGSADKAATFKVETPPVETIVQSAGHQNGEQDAAEQMVKYQQPSLLIAGNQGNMEDNVCMDKHTGRQALEIVSKSMSIDKDPNDMVVTASHEVSSGNGENKAFDSLDGSSVTGAFTDEDKVGNPLWASHLLDWRLLVPHTPCSELGNQAGVPEHQVPIAQTMSRQQLWSWRDLLPGVGPCMLQSGSSSVQSGASKQKGVHAVLSCSTDGVQAVQPSVKPAAGGACWSWSKVAMPVLQAASLEQSGALCHGLQSQLPQLWPNLKALPHMPLHGCCMWLMATDEEWLELEFGVKESAAVLGFSWNRGCTRNAPEDYAGIHVLALSQYVIDNVSELTGIIIKSIAVHPVQIYRATALIHGLQLLAEEVRMSNDQLPCNVVATTAQALHLACTARTASIQDCQPLYPQRLVVLLDAQGFMETPTHILEHLMGCLAAGSRAGYEPWSLHMRAADIAVVEKCGSSQHQAVLASALTPTTGFGHHCQSDSDVNNSIKEQPLLQPLDAVAESVAKETKVLRDAVRLMHVQRPGRIVIAAYSDQQAVTHTKKGRKCKNILAGAVTEVVAFLDILLRESWEQGFEGNAK